MGSCGCVGGRGGGGRGQRGAEPEQVLGQKPARESCTAANPSGLTTNRCRVPSRRSSTNLSVGKHDGALDGLVQSAASMGACQVSR